MPKNETSPRDYEKIRFVDKNLLDWTIFGLFAILVAVIVATVAPQAQQLSAPDQNRKEGIVNGVFSEKDSAFISDVYLLVPSEVRAVSTDTDIVLLGKALALDMHEHGAPMQSLKDMLTVNGFTEANATKFLEIVDQTY